MKHAALFLMTAFVSVAVLVQPVMAQENFEDFIKKSRKDFDELKKDADKEFETLRNSMDKEFAATLDQAWKELELNTGRKFDTTPKPDTPPVARPEPQAPEKEPAKPPVEKPPVKPPEKPQETRVPEEKPAPKPPEEKPQVKEVEKPTVKEAVKPTPAPPTPAPPAPPRERKAAPPEAPEGEPLSIVFYDTPVTLTYDKGMKIDIGSAVSDKSIGTYWMAMSERKYLPLLKQIIALKEQFALNDWGYCLLLDTIAQGVYGRPTNSRNLFVWFMLIQSGYDARIGYSENRVYLLIPSKNQLFSVPFYELSNITYYIASLGGEPESVKSLYTYEGTHKGSEKQLDMNVYRPPAINKKVAQKEQRFSYYDKEYRVPVAYNANIIDYYKFYPQTNLDVYFDASISPESAQVLLDGLQPLIKGKSEVDAVNMLLRFVQVSFAYKTDDEQFQHEKHLFVEETLFYPFCDCEDRSFLFAFLVNRLMGLDVIGLHYPGHVATAVKFNTDVKGDFVTFNNSRYIICDPTYINANYGECMPKFKTVEPKVVPVKLN